VYELSDTGYVPRWGRDVGQRKNGVGYVQRLQRTTEVSAVVAAQAARDRRQSRGESKDTNAGPAVAQDANMGLEDHAMVRGASKHFVEGWGGFRFQILERVHNPVGFLILHSQVTRNLAQRRAL